MNLGIVAIALISALVAYANGANDVSKGIATLAGSGVSSYRRAILWGALWTTCGSIAAFGFSRTMVNTFGRGLLADSVVPTFPAAIATLVGAGLWVGLAARFGFPVSTTHAIVGSIAGVNSIAYGPAGMNWSMLVGRIALPLLVSPVASLLASAAILKVWNRVSPSGRDCLCAKIVHRGPVLASTAAEVEIIPSTAPLVSFLTCRENETAAHSLRAIPLISFDRLHWLSSAAASFARGLNDAPKMVAIALAAAALSGFWVHSSIFAYLLIAVGILLGSLQAGRPVTTVLAEKITPMNHREGFVANVVTSLLVGPGALAGLPMSITHVSSGAIIGIGLEKGNAIDWQRVKDMTLAWFVTLPAAALLGILTYGLLLAIKIG
jgi:PiT family inorganic phosphate transporter